MPSIIDNLRVFYLVFDLLKDDVQSVICKKSWEMLVLSEFVYNYYYYLQVILIYFNDWLNSYKMKWIAMLVCYTIGGITRLRKRTVWGRRSSLWRTPPSWWPSSLPREERIYQSLPRAHARVTSRIQPLLCLCSGMQCRVFSVPNGEIKELLNYYNWWCYDGVTYWKWAL